MQGAQALMAFIIFTYRYFHNLFENVHKTTIGVDFMCQRYRVLGIPFKLQV